MGIGWSQCSRANVILHLRDRKCSLYRLLAPWVTEACFERTPELRGCYMLFKCLYQIVCGCSRQGLKALSCNTEAIERHSVVAALPTAKENSLPTPADYSNHIL